LRYKINSFQKNKSKLEIIISQTFNNLYLKEQKKTANKTIG